MQVEWIHLGAPFEPQLWTVESVRALAGQGLEGDRHFHPDGAKPGQALTLVEAEAVEDVGLQPGETRRQVTVRGVRLNDLVGRRFRVGDVVIIKGDSDTLPETLGEIRILPLSERRIALGRSRRGG